MSTIQILNPTFKITASSADENATLNRYLTHPLSFTTPAGWSDIASKKIADLDPKSFPISAGATAGGQFDLGTGNLSIQLGASASISLADGAVSFQLRGNLQAQTGATVSDFCFGITKGASVQITSTLPALPTDRFVDAVGRTVAAFTIPRDIQDLKSLPPNATCRVEASSRLQFTASVTYNFLNDPLATLAIPYLPAFAVNASAAATLEGAVNHTSDHAITITRLPNGLLQLAVNLITTDDFETSLTVSAGATATIGSRDALAFLLEKISPDSDAELTKIKAGIPAAQAAQLSGDIKAAIDAALSSSLQASLRTSLDDSHLNNRIFLYEIDLTALDAGSTAALTAALAGDFTTLTRVNVTLAGIRQVHSALTATETITHNLALHLLGIFNYTSTSAFIAKTKIDYTKDTHEIVLSDETIKMLDNNLNSEKLRQVVVKGITLTLPASANTPASATPMNLMFFDRQAGTKRSKFRQFVNVLQATGSPTAAAASAVLSQNLKTYGTSSLYLRVQLTPPQCRDLFVDAKGHPYGWATYLAFVCEAQQTILAGDPDSADRLKLFTAGQAFWQQLQNAGSVPLQSDLLLKHGIRLIGPTDVITVIWWSSAMEAYAKALATNQSLIDAGKEVVIDGTLGFDEPWLILATWNMLRKPAIQSLFTSSLLKGETGAAAKA